MKILVTRKELLKAMQRVQGVVEKRHTMPILCNILIETSAGDGEFSLFATDLEIGIKCSYEGRVLEGGRTTVMARKLYEIIRELPESEVLLSTRDNFVRIESGSSRFTILSLPAEDYPPFPSLHREATFPISGVLLSEMIRKVSFAVGENDARYILNGVLFHLRSDPSAREGGGRKQILRVVGTDGHRLTLSEEGCEATKEGMPPLEISAIVPKKAVMELKKVLDEEERSASRTEREVEISLSKNQILFQIGGFLLLSRLMEGTYPNYQQVIPKENDKVVTVNKRQFEGALRRVSVLSREKTNAIELALESGKVLLSAHNPEMGEAEEEVCVNYRGEKIVTGFNARYLLDVLGAIGGEEVLFEFKDPSSPCVIREKGREGYLCVVMPMRI